MMLDPNTITTNKDTSPLLSEEEQSANNDAAAAEDDEEKEIPTCTSYCYRIKYYSQAFRYPLLLLIGNLISLHGATFLIRKSYYMRYYYPSSSASNEEHLAAAQHEAQKTKLLLSAALGIKILTYLIDAYLLLQAARKMEVRYKEHQEEKHHRQQQNNALINEASSSNLRNETSCKEEKDLDFVELSVSVDKAFHCRSDAPNVTFLVCLLYALFSLAIWCTVSSASSLIYLQFVNSAASPTDMRKTASCFRCGPKGYDYSQWTFGTLFETLKTSSNFSLLPSDVQQWIETNAESEINHHNKKTVFNRSLPYIKDKNGTVVFSYRAQDEKSHSYLPGLSVYFPGNESFMEYTAAKNETAISRGETTELVAFPSRPPYYGWCGIFSFDSRSIAQHEVLCYNSKTTAIKRFGPITVGDAEKVNSWSNGKDELYATNSTLWVARKLDISWPEGYGRRHVDTRNVWVTLVSYDISAMERTMAVQVNMTKTEKNNESEENDIVKVSCRAWYRIVLVCSGVALCWVAVYLYRLDIPSCTVPASLILTTLIDAFLSSQQTLIVILLMASSCVLLVATRRRAGKEPSAATLWKYISVEMLVWAQYTFLFHVLFTLLETIVKVELEYIWVDSVRHLLVGPTQFFALGVVTSIAVLLAHPIFEMLAACFRLMALSGLVFVMHGIQNLLITAVLFILSLGCLGVGDLINRYRFHMIVYCRRAWRCFRSCCCGSGGRQSPAAARLPIVR